MKKLLSAILATALSLGLMAVPAAAAFDDGVEIEREEFEASGDSVVELSYFDASRSTDEAVRREILMINSDIDNTIKPQVRTAERTLSDETYEGTFQIHSYSNTSDKFLQIIATSIEYPTYGYDPNVYSWVYDRGAEKYLRLSDVLIKDGLTEDEILKDAEKLYTPFGEEYLFGGKVQGFWICEEEETPHPMYILRMNMVNPQAEEWQTLMVYVPKQYTENGETELFESVIVGEYFECYEAEVKEIDSSNFIKYGVKYEDADGNYIRFLRDKYAIVKVGGKLSSLFWYRNGEKIELSKLTENHEGTLENGTTLKITIDGKDYTLTAKE
ncbi:MAG: hypothetical protein LBL98_04110 [Ruminococcus sp.]|jgi:hypothetical protein|nr:hypothetical protein [Ruminococcus sp.]